VAHQALLFRSWYLYAVFGSAVIVAAIGLALLRRAGATVFGGPLRLPRQPARARYFYGRAGFGLAGSCPGDAVAMVVTGGLGGLLVLAGLVAGLWLRGVTERAASPGRTPPSSGPFSAGLRPGAPAIAAGGGGNPVEQLLVADASVVDQYLYRPGQLMHVGYGAFYLAWVGQVCRHHHHVQLWMPCQQASAQLVQPPGRAARPGPESKPGRRTEPRAHGRCQRRRR
jgi:uncharacterized protein